MFSILILKKKIVVATKINKNVHKKLNRIAPSQECTKKPTVFLSFFISKPTQKQEKKKEVLRSERS